MPKRASVPGDVFGQRRSALDKLTGAEQPEQDAAAVSSQDSHTVQEQHGKTVKPQYRKTVQPQRRTTGTQQNPMSTPPHTSEQATEKVTFYLRPDQLDKIEDLARDYRKRTGQRVRQQDVVRMLIDASTLDSLLDGGEAH